jgi:hypothetical protein
MNQSSNSSQHSDDESLNDHETVAKQSPKRATPIVVPIVTLLKGKDTGMYS